MKHSFSIYAFQFCERGVWKWSLPFPAVNSSAAREAVKSLFSEIGSVLLYEIGEYQDGIITPLEHIEVEL
ncbi:hypothetical protein [Capybara microvirus Cap1_SP_163]|nr:hypothetical protein [Capybara microvirus Cap1_SP_163]